MAALATARLGVALVTGQAQPEAWLLVSDTGRAGTDADSLYLVRSDGTGRRELVAQQGLSVSAPAARADGGAVAFVGRGTLPEGGRVDSIFVAALDDTPPVQITGGPEDSRPAWLSGDTLVFASQLPGFSSLITADEAGANQELLAVLEGGQSQLLEPAVSTTGELAFVVRTGADGELWRMDGDGDRARPLFSHPGWDDRAPAWSPDGRRLAFVSAQLAGSAGRYSLWLYDASTGVAGTLVADPDHDLGGPAWSPEGDRIVFHRRVPGSRLAGIHMTDLAGRVTYVTSGADPAWVVPASAATATASPSAVGPTQEPSPTPTPDASPPVPTFPPPPPTPRPFPSLPTPGPSATGPAPTFPPPTPTPSATLPPASATATGEPGTGRIYLPEAQTTGPVSPAPEPSPPE